MRPVRAHESTGEASRGSQREEVERLFRHVGFLKHRAALVLCYGSGLRISAAVSLKPAHIDSARMPIRVEKGKGAKDRYTVLSARMLNLLRHYWKAQRPTDYLFPSQKASSRTNVPSKGFHCPKSRSPPDLLPKARIRELNQNL